MSNNNNGYDVKLADFTETGQSLYSSTAQKGNVKAEVHLFRSRHFKTPTFLMATYVTKAGRGNELNEEQVDLGELLKDDLTERVIEAIEQAGWKMDRFRKKSHGMLLNWTIWRPVNGK